MSTNQARRSTTQLAAGLESQSQSRKENGIEVPQNQATATDLTITNKRSLKANMPSENETTAMSYSSPSRGKQPLSQKYLNSLFNSSETVESLADSKPRAADLSLLYASVESLGSVGSLGLWRSNDISNIFGNNDFSNIFASSEVSKMPPLQTSVNPYSSLDAALVFASIDSMPLKSLDGKPDGEVKSQDIGIFGSRDWLGIYEGTHHDIAYGLGKDLFRTVDGTPKRAKSKWNEAYLSALQGPDAQETDLKTETSKPEQVEKTASDKQNKGKKRRGEPNEKIYVEPIPSDIISGRGGKSNSWPGNMRYREVIEEAKPAYNEGQKFEKTIKSQEVVDLLLKEGRRFLKLEESPGPHKGEYYLMTKNQARKKAGQALREENTPESRRRKREFYANRQQQN
jgi:hypothetical protein